jgi:hypothetical protein
MGETPSVVPLPDTDIAATILRKRRRTDSTPQRSASHTRSRRSLYCGEDHLAATIDVALSRGPASSRTRGVPSQGTGGAFTTTEESSSLDHRASAGPLRAPFRASRAKPLARLTRE